MDIFIGSQASEATPYHHAVPDQLAVLPLTGWIFQIFRIPFGKTWGWTQTQGIIFHWEVPQIQSPLLPECPAHLPWPSRCENKANSLVDTALVVTVQ